MADLENLATTMGIRIVESNRLDRRLNACWHAPSQTIFVRYNLDPVTWRCAVAHELGHAHNGDECSTERAERAADEYAARTLLDLHNVMEASYYNDGAPSAVAAELGVTPHLLSVWQQMYAAGRIPTNTWCELRD